MSSPPKTIHIASVIPSLALSQGGPTHAFVRLCTSGALLGARQSVFTVASHEPELIPDRDLVGTYVLPGMRLRALRVLWSPPFRGHLAKFCANHGVSLLHSHGLWTAPNHAATSVARKLSLPYMVSPHGMLAPWSLDHKAWKKKMAWRLYQEHDLKRSTVLRATAMSEASDLRRLGLSQPIAVIPNGIELPAGPLDGADRPLPQGSSRKLVFLGRIYPVKGLLNLVEAWARVRPSGWQCIVAGPDESGHRREVESALDALGVRQDFRFPGSVDSAEKWRVLREASMFVLPSFTENFGLVVAEALACGVPVITTTGTPWQELVTQRCGWWVPPTAETLAEALREATSFPESRLREMGARGRIFVRARFSAETVARAMHQVYEWMLGRQPRPDCVIVA